MTAKKVDGRNRTSAANGQKGGRPLAFSTIESMQVVIDQYFADCLTDEKIPGIAGLALALDIDTETLRCYGKKDRFSVAVKRAKQLVETYWEQQLLSPGAGQIFWLKNNAGWKDKVETENNTTMNVSISSVDADL